MELLEKRPPGRPSREAIAARAMLQQEPYPISSPVQPVLQVKIRRFLPVNIDEWFLSRLNDRWPGYTEQTWRGKFQGFSESNEYFCVTNYAAVALFVVMRHAMTGKPIVFEVLAWERNATKNIKGNWTVDDRGLDAVIALYRHANAWRQNMGAVRLMIAACSDVKPSTLRDVLPGAEYMVDVQ